MKKLLRQLPKALLLLLVMLVFVQANAQKRLSPVLINSLSFTISNDVQIDSKTLEFDLYILDTDPAQILDLCTVQAGISIAQSCLNSGIPTGSIISSGMLPAQYPSGTISTLTYGTTTQIKIPPTSQPGCGLGTTAGQVYPGTLFAHVRIHNSVDFTANSHANLNFTFVTGGGLLKPSIYYYPVTCPASSVAVTCNATNCFPDAVNYHNVTLNPPPAPTAYAMTGGGPYCAGATTLPAVGLSNSQVGVTYTLYQNGIAQSPTYLGTGTAIPMGNRPGTFTYSVVGVGNGTNYVGTVPMSTTVDVTMNPTPTITFGPLADVCVGGSAITLTATPAGGAYSGNSYLSGSTFNPSTVGTYPITYNYSNSYGCAAVPVTQNIKVIVCTPTWSGLVNNSWSNPGNWLGNNVPLPTDDAIIPSGCPNYPIIAEHITIHNLTVGSAGAKSSITNLDVTSGGEMDFSGNLTILATGIVDIEAGGAMTIVGNLVITGSLLIESQGSMITNGTVTGHATVQRYIAATDAWHLLSSPVDYQAICNGTFAPLTSAFPFPPSSPITWDFYKWLVPCPAPPLNHWINLRDGSGGLNTVGFGTVPSFDVTKGYLVAYGAGWETKTIKEFVGTPNTGDKTFSFTDITDNCRWALLGNPYPSAIDWSQVTDKTTNLTIGYYYIWNENRLGSPGYEYWLDGYIPSTQGFFVKGKFGSAETLGLPNAARVHDVGADHWLKGTSANRLAITLGNGTYSDEAVVLFGENGNVGKDWYDAEKLFGLTNNYPQVYTIIDNDMKAALNSMPFITNGTTIPVGIVAPVEGNYSITVKGVESFSSLAGLSLEDLSLNYTQNLLQNPVYNFTATGNEDAGRFLLHFAGAIGIDTKDNSPINIFSNEKTVFITCTAGFKNATVTISNLLGQKIVSQNLSDQKMNQVNVNAMKGYYIVKVQSDSSVKTAKVYIN